MKILRVNMSSLTTTFEDLPEDMIAMGGRGLSAKILTAEVPPDTDPLAPEAKLVIAGGPLAGTLAPSCGRISVGAKSPLTMGIKEANAGGPAGQKLDRLGIRAICNWPNASVAHRLLYLAINDEHDSHKLSALRALIRVAPLRDDRSNTERLELLKTAMKMATRDDEPCPPAALTE